MRTVLIVLIRMYVPSEVGKVTLEINGNEALSDESV
jgi:hypothetical protein